MSQFGRLSSSWRAVPLSRRGPDWLEWGAVFIKSLTFVLIKGKEFNTNRQWRSIDGEAYLLSY